MPRISPAEAAEKWARKMQGAGQDYVAGVNRVTQAPGASAAANEAGYMNGVQRSVQTGKWRTNVAKVSLQEWQQAAVNKGASRLAAGAAAAQSKVQAAQERIGPMIDNATRAIANMPRSTPEERIARSSAFQRAMLAAGQRSSR